VSLLEHELADALADALDLLDEALPADHAELNRLGEVLSKANRLFAFRHLGTLRTTPPALSEAEIAQLIAEDEAADRRQAAWERAKEIAERNGEAN